MLFDVVFILYSLLRLHMYALCSVSLLFGCMCLCCLLVVHVQSMLFGSAVSQPKSAVSLENMTSNSTPPSVLWAQRRARVFLTFNVECEKPDIIIEKKTVTFKGACAPDNKLHEVTIPLYAEVDPESSSFRNKGRQIVVILAKENSDEPFWPTLTSDKKKHHWLKVDFEHWQDEDEEDSAPDDFDEINDFANKMELNDDADDKDDSSSSDEEDLPDVQ